MSEKVSVSLMRSLALSIVSLTELIEILLTLTLLSSFFEVIVKPKKERIPDFPLKGRSDVVIAETRWELRLARAKSRLSKAYKLLSEGLEDEAGEEAWRACIDTVNALSTALWGYEVRSHHGISKLVDKLKEVGIIDITTEYGNAESLHNNYYDPHFGKMTIESNIRQVERLIDKVEDAIKKYIGIKLIPRLTLIPEIISESILFKPPTIKLVYPKIPVSVVSG